MTRSLKVLVHPTDLIRGGAYLNALDYAEGIQRRGHDVLVAAPEGELADSLEGRGLRWRRTPTRSRDGLDRSVIRTLSEVAAEFRPDLVHTYEFPAMLHAFYGVHLRRRVPQLATNLSMTTPRVLPRSVPLTLGTKALREEAESFHRAPVRLLEPAIDLDTDRPECVSDAAIRGLVPSEPDVPVVVIVSRLARWMKFDGIRDTILAVGDIAATRPVRLVIAGDGDAFDDVEELARSVNEATGRRTVLLTGALANPRPVYAAADIVVGMGTSAIRGMAFGRPVVVTGIEGFVRPVAPETFDHFDREGLWGIGGSAPPVHEIARLLTVLMDDPGRRDVLGRWGARVARERYGLGRSVERLEAMYLDVVQDGRRSGRAAVDALDTLARRGWAGGSRLAGRLEPSVLRAAGWAYQAQRQVTLHGEAPDRRRQLMDRAAALPDGARRGAQGVVDRLDVSCHVRASVMQLWDEAHGRPRSIRHHRAEGAEPEHAWLEGDAPCHPEALAATSV